jgi:DNA-binding transcriptional MerR regulator
MTEARPRLYRIGELAALSGVPVKTIRYYSDLGVLPPSAVRGSGYRLYSEADRARLALVRSLRDIGVDLATIARLLADRSTVSDTLTLQLDATEVAIRALQRQRAVLRAAVRAARERGGDDALGYLERLQLLARLDAVDRRELLDRYLDRTFDGIPVGERFAADFRRLVTLDVGDELTDAQLEAWVELAALVTDDAFVARVREIGEASWRGARQDAMDDAWYAELRALERRALGLADAGADPLGAEGRVAAAAYVALSAHAAGREPDAAFARELLDRVERAADPRAERFWVLVGILKGWERPEAQPVMRAYRWLFAALRGSVGTAMEGKDIIHR